MRVFEGFGENSVALVVRHAPIGLRMATVFHVPPKGELPLKRGWVSLKSYELLWPVKPFFDLTFGDTNRQLLSVLDKAAGPLERLWGKVFPGAERTPPFAEPELHNICIVMFAPFLWFNWAGRVLKPLANPY